jgi:hypothetical protein
MSNPRITIMSAVLFFAFTSWLFALDEPSVENGTAVNIDSIQRFHRKLLEDTTVRVDSIYENRRQMIDDLPDSLDCRNRKSRMRYDLDFAFQSSPCVRQFWPKLFKNYQVESIVLSIEAQWGQVDYERAVIFRAKNRYFLVRSDFSLVCRRIKLDVSKLDSSQVADLIHHFDSRSTVNCSGRRISPIVTVYCQVAWGDRSNRFFFYYIHSTAEFPGKPYDMFGYFDALYKGVGP